MTVSDAPYRPYSLIGAKQCPPVGAGQLQQAWGDSCESSQPHRTVEAGRLDGRQRTWDDANRDNLRYNLRRVTMLEHPPTKCTLRAAPTAHGRQ